MAPPNGKSILVTGASGMVGRAVVGALLTRFPQARIRAVHFRNDSSLQQDPRIEWVRADLLCSEDCERVSAGCDWAIMAAARTSGSRGMSAEPWKALDENAIMNTRLLETLHFTGVHRVVFISTASVYQEVSGLIREDQLDWNKDPHYAHFGVGWAMRFSEKLCRFWHEATGMEAIIVRAANVFGPFAAFDPQVSNVIPALIRKSVDRMDPFEVWGSPSVVRDVIYSEDFACAVVGLLSHESIKFDIFNVGMGSGTTVGEMVSYVLKTAGHAPSEVKYVPGTPTAIETRALDCSKIRNALSWTPKCSVEEGIASTTKWWKENRQVWKK
ncbi:MAG: NAD-dependent epimerase/dehydratase family protein [Desulfomonilaceae bacterium]